MNALRTLKVLAQGFLQSPVGSVTGLLRRLLYSFWVPPRVASLRESTRHSPLILQIETVNVCNAACLFCAYPGMKRRKGVMELPLFEKVVREYAELGGGAVSLTPIVGDALLDPHLLERLEILERYPAVSQVTLTTNAIALHKYSDQQVTRLLSALHCMQVSIGGLDQATYETMYGVDRYGQVREAMERLVRLRAALPRAAELTFAFRTADAAFEARFKGELESYRRSGVFISHIWTYANYAGAVQADDNSGLVLARNRGKKRLTCVTPEIGMGVCWDGGITACACADFEGDKLRIGQADRESLGEVWRGEKRAAILGSFAKDALPAICRNCSAYTPDTIFAERFFRGCRPNAPLPLDFFHNMMT
jgi:MoaA/NifB/PqqE/SkfB family radical SAM enzyme